MSIVNAMAQQNLASSSAQLGTATANSSFLEKRGNVVGIVLSIIYVCVSVFGMYKVMNVEENMKNKSLILAGLTVPIILAIVDLAYYARHKNDDDQKSVNSTVGNISLIPVYLVFALIVITVIFHMR